jgi:hypothetical protein
MSFEDVQLANGSIPGVIASHNCSSVSSFLKWSGKVFPAQIGA